MQEARARLHERARGLERVVGVDGLLVEVALAQAHGLAVADVHRRAGGSCAAAERHEVPQQPQPVRARLLGVGLEPVDRRPLHHAHELAPVVGRAEHVVGVGGPRRERVRVVEGAGVGQALVERARRAASSPGSSRSAGPSGRARRAPRPARAAARSPRRRPARWWTRTAAASPCRGRSPAPRPRPARAAARRAPAAHALHRLRHGAHARAARSRRPRARARGRSSARARRPRARAPCATERRFPMP